MADTSTSILPDRADSDASTPTLMSLPFEMVELILQFLLPDKDVLERSLPNGKEFPEVSRPMIETTQGLRLETSVSGITITDSVTTESQSKRPFSVSIVISTKQVLEFCMDAQ